MDHPGLDGHFVFRKGCSYNSMSILATQKESYRSWQHTFKNDDTVSKLLITSTMIFCFTVYAMFLQLCCKAQLKQTYTFHIIYNRCNIAVTYSKPGQTLVQRILKIRPKNNTNYLLLRITNRLHFSHKLHDTWFTSTETELINMKVDGHCFNKARHHCNQPGPLQEQTSNPGCQTPDPNSPAHMNLII